MNNTTFTNSNISELQAIKSSSKEIYYLLYTLNIKCIEGGEYIKTALDLKFDELYSHQINEMAGELSLYLYYNGSTATVQEIIELQQYNIDNYVPKCSSQGILEYIINNACRQAFIMMLYNRKELYAVG